MARRKAARVVVRDRQTDIDIFLHVFECYVWVTIGTIFAKTWVRHGVAVTILDVKSGEVLPPTPLTVGPVISIVQEEARRARSVWKVKLLLEHPELVTSSQISDDASGAIRVLKGTPNEYLIAAAGLEGAMNEALVYAACVKTWYLSEQERMELSFRSGKGPNTDINTTMQYDGILAYYLREKGGLQDFKPDFDKLEDFSPLLV